MPDARRERYGVDGGNQTPLHLYQAAGFQTISTTLILEKPIESTDGVFTIKL